LNPSTSRRTAIVRLCAATFLAAALLPGLPAGGSDPQAGLPLDPLLTPRPAIFAFDGDRLGHRVGSGFVLPGDSIRIEVSEGGVTAPYSLVADQGTVVPLGDRSWTWIAPATTGLTHIVAVDSLGLDTMRINAFVMVPYSELKKGMLRGYRIGEYPAVRELGGVRYERPRGFIELTADNQFTFLSPHFQLGQFECQRPGRSPRYVVLTPRLMAKLEAIVDGLQMQGHPCATLGIMSGYRTPYDNHAMGHARYSRHQYGDAADFFVDAAPLDGRMDDLNGDGRVNSADAHALQCVIETLAVDARDDIMPGGLGTYGTSHMHGPFVHTDARGFRTRWALSSPCNGAPAQAAMVAGPVEAPKGD